MFVDNEEIVQSHGSDSVVEPSKNPESPLVSVFVQNHWTDVLRSTDAASSAVAKVAWGHRIDPQDIRWIGDERAALFSLSVWSLFCPVCSSPTDCVRVCVKRVVPHITTRNESNAKTHFVCVFFLFFLVFFFVFVVFVFFQTKVRPLGGFTACQCFLSPRDKTKGNAVLCYRISSTNPLFAQSHNSASLLPLPLTFK